MIGNRILGLTERLEEVGASARNRGNAQKAIAGPSVGVTQTRGIAEARRVSGNLQREQGPVRRRIPTGASGRGERKIRPVGHSRDVAVSLVVHSQSLRVFRAGPPKNVEKTILPCGSNFVRNRSQGPPPKFALNRVNHWEVVVISQPGHIDVPSGINRHGFRVAAVLAAERRRLNLLKLRIQLIEDDFGRIAAHRFVGDLIPQHVAVPAAVDTH